MQFFQDKWLIMYCTPTHIDGSISLGFCSSWVRHSIHFKAIVTVFQPKFHQLLQRNQGGSILFRLSLRSSWIRSKNRWYRAPVLSELRGWNYLHKQGNAIVVLSQARNFYFRTRSIGFQTELTKRWLRLKVYCRDRWRRSHLFHD